MPHESSINLTWTGNLGPGTTTYDAYERSHEFHAPGKPILKGSSAPEFRGDESRYSPEDLLLAAVSSCHMLWYLHLCAQARVVVTAYRDQAMGRLTIHPNGSGEFKRIELRPVVTITPSSDEQRARSLHLDASNMCFIARSLKCAVEYTPEIRRGT